MILKFLPPVVAIFGVVAVYNIFMASPYASDGALLLTVTGIISGLGGYSAVELFKYIRNKRKI